MQTNTVTPKPKSLFHSKATGKQAALRIQLGKEAPVEVRLFRYGLNETTKGTFLFDDISAEYVMKDHREYGNERSADYEHQALYDPPIKAPASAWYDLELRREDGLYAVNIQWTEEAKRMIEAGEYRYISPAFFYDSDDMRIMGFINFALTNLPATRSMEALLKHDPLVEFVANNYDTLLNNGLIEDDSTEVHRKAIQGLREASKEYVKAFSEAEEVATEGEVEEVQSYTTGSESLQGASQNHKPQDPTPKKDTTMDNEVTNTILAALGLTEDATPRQITEAVEARTVSSLTPIREALGISDGDNKVITEKVVALRRKNTELEEKVTKLTKDLKELRTLSEEHTVDVLLKEARAEGKLYEGTEDLYLKVLRDDNGHIDVDRLRTLLDGLPPLGKITAPKQEADRARAQWSGREWKDLTPMDKLRLYEDDPALYTTLKTQAGK